MAATSNYNPTGTALLFLLTFTTFLHLSSSKTHPSDITVLKHLKNSINPTTLSPGSCISSWDFTSDPCDTLFGSAFTCGFTCNIISGTSRIIELTLDKAGYSASLSYTPWNHLTFLENLDLSGNNFTGNIPDSLFELRKLRILSLSGNVLEGEVPESIGKVVSLEELYLDNNLLQRKIPGGLNGLKNVKTLELQGNRFSGELPDLGGLNQLNYFDAGENLISGEIPLTLPASLLELSLRNNLLQGSIPESIITNLVNLQVLDLSHNQLSGSLPSALFTHPSLQQLTLSTNNFTTISSSSSTNFVDDSSLIALDLSNNELTGLLPGFIGEMPKLSALNLENNRFTGMIPIQYAIKTVVPGLGMERFERLLLGGNYLFGPIPGPLVVLEKGSANVSLVRNCLFRCVDLFWFCQGGEQKSIGECRGFAPVIP